MRDGKATKDVDRGDGGGDNRQDGHDDAVRINLRERTNNDDAGNRVRHGHEGRVQGVCHRRNDVKAHHNSQREDEEVPLHPRRRGNNQPERNGRQSSSPSEPAKHMKTRRIREWNRRGLRVLSCWRRHRDLDGRRRPGDATAQRNGYTAHDFIGFIEGQQPILIRCRELKEVDDVLPVKLGGLTGKAALQVWVTDDGYAVGGPNGFPGR